MREHVSFEEFEEKLDKYFESKTKEELRLLVQAFALMYSEIKIFMEKLGVMEEFVDTLEIGTLISGKIITEFLKDQRDTAFKNDT